MSDPPTSSPEPVVEPGPLPPAETPERRSLLPWLSGLGFVVLAVALVWVWLHPRLPPATTDQTDALARQIAALETRVARLEQRPVPQVPDLAPLNARVAALEQRPPAQAAAPAPPPDLGPLENRISALEHRPPPDLAPLEARIAALESASRSAEAQQSQHLAAEDQRLTQIDRMARRIPTVLSAAFALAAGQKLGELPGAPPALTRFADTRPPTEAALRLAFPGAARGALAAAHPNAQGKPLLTRLWAQAQDLVTVRQGDRVLIGDPAAGVLERARADLDAGDLAAAAAEVATLQGPPAEAMAGWLADARALLEARAALAAWAKSG